MFKEDIDFFLKGSKPAIMLRKNAAKNFTSLNDYKSFLIGESKVWFKNDADFEVYARTGCLATLLGYPKQSIKDVEDKIADTYLNFQGMYIKCFNKNIDKVVNELKVLYGDESVKTISTSKCVSKLESVTRVRVQQDLLERQLTDTMIALIPIAKDRNIRYDNTKTILKLKVANESMYLASKDTQLLIKLTDKPLVEAMDEVVIHPDLYEGFEETNSLYLVEHKGIRFLADGEKHVVENGVRLLKKLDIQSGKLPDIVRLLSEGK